MVSSSIKADTSSSNPQWKYDVFLSFRGEDTRKNFVDHLYGALSRRGIYTFKDDVKLERGKEISPALRKAIEESRFAIVIFSKNYASSTWCLDELVKIVQCTRARRQTILPVFYGVNPSDVRKQKGSYGEALAKHEVVFKKQMNKVESWRVALSEAANVCGWVLYITRNGLKEKLIQDLVGHILSQLSCTKVVEVDDSVGLDSHDTELSTLLGTGTEEVQIFENNGMGGMDKTTVEGSNHLANVKEVSKSYGLPLIQKLLSKILLERNIKITNVDRGANIIGNRQQHIGILLVLDHVDHLDLLETLARKHDWVELGRIINMTPRNIHLMTRHEMTDEEAIDHFSCKAFGGNQPTDVYQKLVSAPLALRVFGASLFGQNTVDWESVWNGLEGRQNIEVLEVLKINSDRVKISEKKIFLDTENLFSDKSKIIAENVLDGDGFYPDIGISILLKKSPVTIIANKLSMSLIQEMVWHIIYEVTAEESGIHSRL